MTLSLKDFSLLKEDNDNYHVGHPKGKSMVIPKKGLSTMAQQLVEKLKREQHFADGTPDGTEEVPAEAPTSESTTDSPESIAADAAAMAPAPNITAETEQAAVAPDQAATQDVPVSQAPSAAPSATPNVGTALDTASKANQAGVTAADTAGKATAKAYGDEATNVGKIQKSMDDDLKDFNTKDLALDQSFANKKVDYNRYLNNQGLGSKISSGIAMILGGIGGGLTHQANPAIQFMKDAINRDIESQQNDQSKAMNLWKMNRANFSTNQETKLAMENQYMAIAKAKAMSAGAASGGGAAAQNAAKFGLAIDEQRANNNWMLSRAGGGAPGTEQQHVTDLNTMQRMNPELYKDMQAKYIPGVGTAKVAVPQADRDAFTSYSNLGDQMDQLTNFAQQKGTTIPGSPADQQAHDLQNAAQLEIGNLLGLKRINEFEAEKYTDMIKNPGALRTQQAVQSFNDFKNLINGKKQSMTKSLGITPFQQAPQDQQAIAWAKLNPTDPRSKQILASNGQQ